ncbi:MAG: STAS domain-containing protein [Planctomycetota bacterium]|jgi:anti-anti-sigma regulatory factor
MITSYLSPEGSLLYLSLVGRLDLRCADDLVHEFTERRQDDTQQCILDLRGAAECDAGGLGAVQRLAKLSIDHGLRFGITAGNGPTAEAIRRQAGEWWMDGLPEIPLPA